MPITVVSRPKVKLFHRAPLLVPYRGLHTMNFSSLRLCATRAVANSFPHGNFLSDFPFLFGRRSFHFGSLLLPVDPACLRWRFMTAQQGQRRRIIETREVEEDVQFKMLSSDLSLLFFASSLCEGRQPQSSWLYTSWGLCSLL